MDISGGGAEGGGSSSVSGNVSASTQITMTTSLSGVASSLSGLASQMRMLSGEMAGMSAELQSDVLAINEKVNEITDTAYDLLYGEEDDLIVDSSAIAPGVKELDVRFGEGLAQVTLEDGRIQRLTFQVDGSAAVAMVDVPVSFTAQFTIPNTPEQFVIPEAVRSALER